MAQCKHKNPCRGAGVGPSCAAPDLKIDDPEHQFSTDGKDVPTVNSGDYYKQKCLKKMEEDFKEYIKSCTCDCMSQSPRGNDIAYNQGYDLWCWAECHRTAITQFEFSDCFCQEVTCGGDDDDNDDTDPTNPTDPTDPTDPENPGKTTYDFARLGPTIRALRTKSSYDEFIPKVFNRSVVDGNIIWIGNARTKTHDVITQAVTGNNVTITTTTVTQTFCDVAVALCEGEIAGVARLWFNNRLVYNNVMDVDEVGRVTANSNGDLVLNIENSAFFDKVDNADKYEDTVARFTIFRGTEDQEPVGVMAAESPIGYRGVAYILIENLDVTQSSGSVPNLRVDIVEQAATVPPTQVAEFASSTLTTIEPDALLVDETNRLVIVGASASESGYRAFGMDDLVEGDTYAPGVTTGLPDSLILETTAISDEGYIFAQDINGVLRLLNTLTAASEASYSGLPTLGRANLIFRPRLSDSTTPLVFAATSHRDLYFLRLDSFGTSISLVGTSLNFTEFDMRKMVYFEEDGVDLDTASGAKTNVKRNLLAVFATPTVTVDHIQLRILNVFDSNQTPAFVPGSLNVQYDQEIPASAWGGDTQVTFHDVLRDARDNGMIVLLRRPDGTGYALKWDYANEEVVWSVNMDVLPPLVAQGPRVGSVNFDAYAFIGADSIVYSLSAENGYVKNLGPAPEDIHAFGAQYYDPATSSITYLTAANEPFRMFVGRLASRTTTLNVIVNGILEKAGLNSEVFDTSSLASVLSWGYAITSQSLARGALAQLMLAYSFVGVEDNYRLTFRLLADAASETITHDDLSATSSVFERTMTVLDADVLAVELEYRDIDKGMAPTTQTLRSGQGSYQKLTETVALSFPITATETEAIHMAEKLYARSTYNNVTAEVQLSAAFSHMQPGDYVRAYDAADQFHDYLVEHVTRGADHTVMLSLTRDTQALHAELANVTSIEGQVDFTGSLTPFQFTPVRRPLLIVTNALTDEQVSLGANLKRSGFFIGADYRGALPMPATPLYISLDGAYLRAGVATEPVQWGTVTAVPSTNDSSIYTVDHNDSFTVRFTRTDAVNLFRQDATLADLLADGTLNLILVNDELVQFQSYAAVDAHTVTFQGLLRGRRGTEWARHTQAVGGLAVAYSATSWVYDSITATAATEALTAATTNSNGKFVTTTKVTDHPMLKYYAPGNLKRARRISGDVVFTFQQRTRLLGDDELAAVQENDTPLTREAPQSAFSVDMFILSGPLDVNLLKEALAAVDAGGTHAYIKRSYIGVQPATVNFNVTPAARVTPAITYSLVQQNSDGVDSSTDTLYVVLFESALTDEFLTRGHFNYREIKPSDAF